MAQEKITINGIEIRQPDKGFQYGFSTTHTADSTRLQNGGIVVSPMFTNETFNYSASFLTVAEMKTILQEIAKGNPFMLHYFSPYYGTWRTDSFYVPNGSLSIGRLNENEEKFQSLSFQMIGVNPI